MVHGAVLRPPAFEGAYYRLVINLTRACASRRLGSVVGSQQTALSTAKNTGCSLCYWRGPAMLLVNAGPPRRQCSDVMAGAKFVGKAEQNDQCTLDRTIFDQAQRQIYNLIETDLFPRFIQYVSQCQVNSR
ncbi:unnamed protein product [Ectocarpus sp. 13 AM-2016]